MRKELPLVACCVPLDDEPLGPDQAERLAPVFKALGDPARLRLVSLIASWGDGAVCVCELTPLVGLSQPTVSHHLRVLREAGLVEAERRGTWMYYRMEPATVRAVAGLFAIDAPESAVMPG